MQPVDIRVEPWVWVPLSRRRGRVLPTVIVAALAAAAGYTMGRHSDKRDETQPQRTVAASPPAGVNWKAKPKDAGEKPDLALKGAAEIAKPTAAPTQANSEVPPVVVLNPGTADPKGNSRDPAPTRESRAAPVRTSADEPPPADVGNNRLRDERGRGSRGSMRDYRGLREYMLGR